MFRNDELLEQIAYLEGAKCFWKGLALSLAALLVLFLALGSALGFSVYFQTQNRRLEAEMELRDALQREAVARQQAQQALQEAAKAINAAEKQKLGPENDQH